MSDTHVAGINVVFCGLEEVLAAQLRNSVSRFANVRQLRSAASVAECVAFVDRFGAGVIFCSADRKQYCALLKALNQRSLRPAVVVASRLPEVSEWLYAL